MSNIARRLPGLRNVKCARAAPLPRLAPCAGNFRPSELTAPSRGGVGRAFLMFRRDSLLTSLYEETSDAP